jgi:hypothetical protein
MRVPRAGRPAQTVIARTGALTGWDALQQARDHVFEWFTGMPGVLLSVRGPHSESLRQNSTVMLRDIDSSRSNTTAPSSRMPLC